MSAFNRTPAERSLDETNAEIRRLLYEPETEANRKTLAAALAKRDNARRAVERVRDRER